MTDTENGQAEAPERVEALVKSPEGMPHIKTVSLAYGRKVNLGNWSSADLEFRLWADITDEDDLDEGVAMMWEYAVEQVKTQLAPLLKSAPAQPAKKRAKRKARRGPEPKKSAADPDAFVRIGQISMFDRDGETGWRVYGPGFQQAGLAVHSDKTDEFGELLGSLGAKVEKMEPGTKYDTRDLGIEAHIWRDKVGTPLWIDDFRIAD